MHANAAPMPSHNKKCTFQNSNWTFETANWRSHCHSRNNRSRSTGILLHITLYLCVGSTSANDCTNRSNTAFYVETRARIDDNSIYPLQRVFDPLQNLSHLSTCIFEAKLGFFETNGFCIFKSKIDGDSLCHEAVRQRTTISCSTSTNSSTNHCTARRNIVVYAPTPPAAFMRSIASSISSTVPERTITPLATRNPRLSPPSPCVSRDNEDSIFCTLESRSLSQWWPTTRKAALARYWRVFMNFTSNLIFWDTDITTHITLQQT